jgi:hypothetical protein
MINHSRLSLSLGAVASVGRREALSLHRVSVCSFYFYVYVRFALASLVMN